MTILFDMNALDYILSSYQHPKYEESLKERSVLKALVHTLQPEELKILKKKLKRGYSKRSVGYYLHKAATMTEMRSEPLKNETISALLKQFVDKRSRKVEIARTKLRYRFDKQDFQQQRKILAAFLAAAKQDRIWAYKQLQHWWDDRLYDEVRTLWELHHEEECGRVILLHFPMEYVYDNLAYLDRKENYFQLCVRLINHPSFQIDKGRLEELYGTGKSDVAYLRILAYSNSKVQKGAATRILYEQIIRYLNENDSYSKEFEIQFNHHKHNCPTTKWFLVVSLIVGSMGELNLADELIAYEEWDSIVQRKFLCNADYKELLEWGTDDFISKCYMLFRETIAECLPDEYKHLVRFPTPSADAVDGIHVDELQENPTLNLLIDQLDLEVVE